MSFLNSVLSSIGGNGAPISTTPARIAGSQSTDTGSRGDQPQERVRPVVASALQSNKRKAEDALGGPESKNVKNAALGGPGSCSARQTDRRISKLTNSSSPLPLKLTATAGLIRKSSDSPSIPSSRLDIPYRGTSRPNPATVAAPTSAGSVASTNLAGEVAKAPKKGSYAEIMARAKATQSKAPVIGVISHKPKNQMPISYKKELKMQNKALKNKKLGIKTTDHPSSSGSMSSSPAQGASDVKIHPQPPNKGTAKPPKPQPTYRGTMASSTVTAKPTKTKPEKSRYDEYAATDEDDIDEIEEDEYGSEEESDDMEAGFSDVEQEESAAAKAARKEDEQEARMEAKLKVEKEERKKKLAEMARKARPQRY